MNGKIWVLGDAVVDLLPDGEAACCNAPAARRPRGGRRGAARR